MDKMTMLNRVLKALSDANRVRAYMALRQGERCVCELIELLDLAPSTVSKHMSILKTAGLVTSRKDSRWVYYAQASFPAKSFMNEFTRSLIRYLADDRGIREDDSATHSRAGTLRGSVCAEPQSREVSR